MKRKDMIAYCVDDQIRRGVIDAKNREVQIHYRLEGIGFAKPMSYADCKKWYDEVRKAR